MEYAVKMYLNTKKQIMKLEQDKVYHVYNRGNNQQLIFFKDENYLFFLRKMRKLLLPQCEILAYCLMPNHFHLLIYTTENSIRIGKNGLTNFSEAIRQMLSQYTKAINKQENRSASLFQQNTKAKEMEVQVCHENRDTPLHESALTCFVYIHKNPREITCNNLAKWKYSSYLDYAGLRCGTLCNKDLTMKLLNFRKTEFADMLHG